MFFKLGDFNSRKIFQEYVNKKTRMTLREYSLQCGTRVKAKGYVNSTQN